MKKLLNILVILTLILTGCSQPKDEEKKEIKVYTRDTSSGTRDGFFTAIDFKDAVTDNSKLVSGYIEVAGNGDMVNAIKNDEYGIGYISLSSLENSGLTGLKIDGVEPTEENVINGTYSLTRNFNYIVATQFASEKEEQIVAAYLAYLQTKEAKATIIQNDGIVEIKDDDPSWETLKNDYPIVNEDNSNITIKFGGSTSVEKIAKALSLEFSQKCGNFKFEHNHTGSSDAFKRTQGSEKDGANSLHIGFASREFKLDDSEKAAQDSYGKICTDAISVVVNKANSITEVTKEQLKDIFSGKVVNWNE